MPLVIMIIIIALMINPVFGVGLIVIAALIVVYLLIPSRPLPESTGRTCVARSCALCQEKDNAPSNDDGYDVYDDRDYGYSDDSCCDCCDCSCHDD